VHTDLPLSLLLTKGIDQARTPTLHNVAFVNLLLESLDDFLLIHELFLEFVQLTSQVFELAAFVANDLRLFFGLKV